MPESERTPLLDASRALDGRHDAHSIEHNGGKFGSELWLLFRTTIPVMAGAPLRENLLFILT